MNIEIEKKVSECEESAKNYFRVGLNCSECVLLSFLDNIDTGFPREVMCMATGFGGGIGHTGGVCGAVTGAIMAVGTIKGRRNPLNESNPYKRSQELKQLYPIFQSLVEEVEEEFGSTVCRELITPFREDPQSKKRWRSCQSIVEFCSGLAAKYALTEMEYTNED